jgi:hypothetical protein
MLQYCFTKTKSTHVELDLTGYWIVRLSQPEACPQKNVNVRKLDSQLSAI